jgi:tetratricopeptide (TPR) repeat protein
MYPNATYIFKHALTREVVYESILTKRRKEIHAAVAEAMEETWQSNLAEHLGTLCDHFMAGENYEKGEVYAKLAAKKAVKAGSMPEAIDQGVKRIACLEKMPLTDDGQKKIIDARTVLALNLAQLSHYVEAKDAIYPIIDLAEKMGYKRRLCQIKTILGTYYAYAEENLPAAFQAFEEALTIAEEVNDIITLILANNWFGINLALNCEFEKATFYMQKALDILTYSGILHITAPFKAVFATCCLFNQGKIDSGFQMSAEAVQLSVEGGDSFSKGVAYVTHGFFCYGKGLFEKAEESFLRGIGFCERVNERPLNAMAHFYLGEILFERNDFPISMEFYKKGRLLLKYGQQVPSFKVWSKVGQLRAMSMIKPTDIDLKSLYTLSTNNKRKVIQGWISSYIGAILMNMGDGHLSEAKTWIQKAIEEDQTNGTRFLLGRDYALYAEWFERKGDHANVRENLGKAIEIMKECGADGWVVKYEKELNALQ